MYGKYSDYEDDNEDEFDDYDDNFDDDDDDDDELGGWAVVHESGDLIADGFDTEEQAATWIEENEDFLEDDPGAYHVTEVED